MTYSLATVNGSSVWVRRARAIRWIAASVLRHFYEYLPADPIFRRHCLADIALHL